MRRGDFAQLVGHSGAAGDAGDKPLGALQHTFEHPLGATHLPQHVDVDRALAARDVIGALNLRHRAVDGVLDKLLMPLAASQ